MSLFIQECTKGLHVNFTVIEEGMFSDAMDSFISYAEKKLKGYSVSEVDRFAKRAKSIDSEEKKRSVLADIEKSRKLCQEKLKKVSKKDKEKELELRRQIQVLGELSVRVKRFKIADDHPEKSEPEKHKINLDEQ